MKYILRKLRLSKNVVLTQHRAIPDGYTYNFENLKDSIKKTHTEAEKKRQDTVDAQEHADAWRYGWTPSSGPLVLNQMTNPTDADTYGTHKDNLKAALKAQQDFVFTFFFANNLAHPVIRRIKLMKGLKVDDQGNDEHT